MEQVSRETDLALEENPEWYGEDENPVYRTSLSRADELSSSEDTDQLVLARRFISHWLENDNHGFVIPGTEWGKELLWAIKKLLGATNPPETED